MKYTRAIGVAFTLLGLANAQSSPKPSSVTILTPLNGVGVGVQGKDWMIDIQVEFTPVSASSSSSASAAAATAPAPATTSASSGSTSSSGGYRLAKRNNDDGFVPFLNSPNLTTFKPGPDPFAPGLVVLVNTSAAVGQNFGGVFQLNAITNSDAQGNILEAFFTWFIGSAAFPSGVPTEVLAFFVNGTAPSNYTANPFTDPNVVTNVATANFTIFGGSASNTTAPATVATPLEITIFAPSNGAEVGVNGGGWLIDFVAVSSDLPANYFRPTAGYKPLYHDNFSDPTFKPEVVSEALPGLVVLSNTSTLAGGANGNLANLFQINAPTNTQANGTISEYWATWLAGSAFAGQGKASSITIFFVNGTAPTQINGSLPDNIISNIATVNFTTSSNATATSGSGSTGTSSGGASGSGSGSASAKPGAASTLSIGVGTIVVGAIAFLLITL